MSDLKDMLGKKPKSNDADVKEAKLTALKELKGMASGMLGGGLKEMMDAPKKSVTVAADSEEGLEAGLDKAKEILPEMPDMDDESEDSDSEDMSMEEIEAMERQIAEMKKKLLAAKA